MSANIRYPNINGLTDKEQLSQIKSYLHQLVEQLNYSLSLVSDGEAEQSTATVEVQGSEMSYYELRSLIMAQLNDVSALTKKLENAFVSKTGWAAGKHLTTNEEGNVVATDAITKADMEQVAAAVVDRISFSMDDDYNLYYEVLEE